MRFEYPIIDADAHVNPPHDFWQSYLPESLKSLAPIVEHGDEFDFVIFEGKKRKINLIGAQAGRSGKDFKLEGRVSDQRSGGWMPAERIEDMDIDGIDVQIMFGGGPLGTANRELYIESYRAYNRWLADFCAYKPDRLAGVAYLPMQDVDETIALLKEAAALGYRTVNIPAFPQAKEIASNAAQGVALTGNPEGERQYDSPEFNPFWQAVLDHGMTIAIHLGARLPRFQEPRFFLPDLLMSKFAMAEPIAVLIFGGVFQRYPALKFVSVESGVGWFAFAANYMDNTWKKQRFWTKSELTQPPSFYMDQNVYGSFINDPIGIAMRGFPGAKNIMWSSDYPHSETTYPNSHDVIAENFAGVPEDDKRMILSDRAREVFHTR